MTYCKSISEFLNGFSRGDIIAIIAIAIGIIFMVWWDRRKKRQSIIDVFTNSIVELKTVIETNSIPNRASSDVFFTNLFAKQDVAMSVIRSRLDVEAITEFDKKWEEYKEERERYNRYWNTNLKGKFLIHSYSNQLINITEELIKIANKI
jgi:hypothetical protein